MMVEKIVAWIPSSRELLIDSLSFTTMFLPIGEKAVAYLRLGQSFPLGRDSFNPAEITEVFEYGGLWDEAWYLPHLDWPDWGGEDC